MDIPKVEILPIEKGATPDLNNINRHSARGGALVTNSLQRRGAFRSIASAGKGVDVPTVYAGNLTLEKAVEAGFTEIVNVHVTGGQLVNVVRDDIEPGSAEAVALGLEDNESGKQSYNPDIDILAALAAGDNALLSALRKDDRTLNQMIEGMEMHPKNIGRDGRLYLGHDVEPIKLAFRVEACWRANEEVCVDVFSGEGFLSNFYKRRFKNVITNDKDTACPCDFHMEAEDFIISGNMPRAIDFIDFDDEGNPNIAIQKYIPFIKNRQILCLTNGDGLNLKLHGHFSPRLYGMEGNVRQATTRDYENLEELETEFINRECKKYKLSSTLISSYRGREGNVLYQVWEIFP